MKIGIFGYKKDEKGKFKISGGMTMDSRGRERCKQCGSLMKHPLGGFCNRKCYDAYKKKNP